MNIDGSVNTVLIVKKNGINKFLCGDKYSGIIEHMYGKEYIICRTVCQGDIWRTWF